MLFSTVFPLSMEEEYGRVEEKAGDEAENVLPEGQLQPGTEVPAQANAEWREIGYDKSPIAAGTEVYHISAGDHAYVRVYRRAAGNYAGRWIMRAEDIAGLTGAEIAEKYALPVIPDMICDVKLPPELELEVSIAGEQKQWRRSHGGNVQYGIKSTRPKDVWFINRRRLNE